MSENICDCHDLGEGRNTGGMWCVEEGNTAKRPVCNPQKSPSLVHSPLLQHVSDADIEDPAVKQNS